jgi:hypothetical protein
MLRFSEQRVRRCINSKHEGKETMELVNVKNATLAKLKMICDLVSSTYSQLIVSKRKKG